MVVIAMCSSTPVATFQRSCSRAIFKTSNSNVDQWPPGSMGCGPWHCRASAAARTPAAGLPTCLLSFVRRVAYASQSCLFYPPSTPGTVSFSPMLHSQLHFISQQSKRPIYLPRLEFRAMATKWMCLFRLADWPIRSSPQPSLRGPFPFPLSSRPPFALALYSYLLGHPEPSKTLQIAVTYTHPPTQHYMHLPLTLATLYCPLCLCPVPRPLTPPAPQFPRGGGGGGGHLAGWC